MNQAKRYAGCYRGTVGDNNDPKGLGRLKVVVPDVLGDETCVWAVPAALLAGPGMGISCIPPVNTGVWVEFEQGDPNYPVWTGTWRASTSDLPQAAAQAPPGNPPIVLQGQSQNQLVISSVPGEAFTLETSAGAQGPRIVVTSTSITLSTGKGATVELSGQLVRINGNSLTVNG
ncbi:phage baseplate assembly protein V [Streptomyces sp. ODS28]|uniref:phage baseplate assembly protein V n=1 Tax=Streptomyces sp. ODS28 TaxID=3136688 RepID=UPI0031EABA15